MTALIYACKRPRPTKGKCSVCVEVPTAKNVRRRGCCEKTSTLIFETSTLIHNPEHSLQFANLYLMEQREGDVVLLYKL